MDKKNIHKLLRGNDGYTCPFKLIKPDQRKKMNDDGIYFYKFGDYLIFNKQLTIRELKMYSLQ